MKKLGRMVPFYRNQAILSEKMFTGGLEPGGEMCKVPDYLQGNDIDFPYLNKKPGEKEVMFTDHISLVRFLGGVGDEAARNDDDKKQMLDLVYRDEKGSIQFRDNLIERYRPFVNIYGKNITLVLDNIPWAFVKETGLDSYGQINPPEDLDEWSSFISNMCVKLIDAFGYDTVNSWRFRLSTEARLKVDSVDYCRIYDISAQAVNKILPGALFGPYNVAGVAGTHQQHIDMYVVANHCAAGMNAATGGRGAPMEFAPVSFYSIPRIDSKNQLIQATLSPLDRVISEYKTYWDAMSEILNKTDLLSREIHELGILTNEYSYMTCEPGARGSAWLLQLMFNMKEHADIDKVWHWHTTDTVLAPGTDLDNCKRILRSNGWLFEIMDHMEGLDTYVLDSSNFALKHQRLLILLTCTIVQDMYQIRKKTSIFSYFLL